MAFRFKVKKIFTYYSELILVTIIRLKFIKNYFRDFWNILDFVIVVGSIFDVAMIFVRYNLEINFQYNIINFSYFI